MKNKFTDRLLAPNLWIGVFSVLAVAGIVCLSLGYKKVGLWLLAPLLVGGLLVLFVLIPVLIRANRKHHDRSKGDRGTSRVGRVGSGLEK